MDHLAGGGHRQQHATLHQIRARPNHELQCRSTTSYSNTNRTCCYQPSSRYRGHARGCKRSATAKCTTTPGRSQPTHQHRRQQQRRSTQKTHMCCKDQRPRQPQQLKQQQQPQPPQQVPTQQQPPQQLHAPRQSRTTWQPKPGNDRSSSNATQRSQTQSNSSLRKKPANTFDASPKHPSTIIRLFQQVYLEDSCR